MLPLKLHIFRSARFLFLVGGFLVAAGCQPPPSADNLEAAGETYARYCAQCHYDGEGDGFANPALLRSPVVAGPPGPLIDIILHGQQGKSLIDGRPGNGIMPAQAYLTDQEIADALTYIRARFGGGASPVTPGEVRARRDRVP